MRKLTQVMLVGLLGLQPLSIAWAQKKPLDHTVYDAWETVSQKQISKNGNWLQYTVRPQEGDVNLFLQAIHQNNAIHIPRAAVANFTNTDKFAVGVIKPFYKD